MDEVLKIVVMGRAARNAANIKNRQPIGQMFVKTADGEGLDSFFSDIITDELNVKKITFTSDVREFTSYNFKPQLRTVGPKYGKQLGGIRTYLAEVDGNAAMDELRENGALKFEVAGVHVELSEEDLLIEPTQKEGYVSEADNAITVVLDTNLTQELIEEGFVRELTSKIQTMRKEAGFEVMDRITVYAQGNEKICEILERFGESVCGDVLADEIVLRQEPQGYVKDWNVNSEHVTLGVKKN